MPNSTRKIQIQGSLSLRQPAGGITVEPLHDQLLIQLEHLRLIQGIPFSKRKTFRLFQLFSKHCSQTIVVQVDGKKWLSVRSGKWKIHNWMLSFQALFL